ncbi:hypothetical protein LTR08_003028 [Meristemomyces frigidus]|nr:hypothetical protein LTR08_003028 [Meristemomyces frigidus]
MSLQTPDALIRAEMPPAHTALHPSIPALRAAHFSARIATELDRLACGTARAADPATATGIDLTRYEAPHPPFNPTDAEAWQTTLRQAATSAAYLRSREVNLALLETYGKNAWLVANSQLEDELRSLEREVEVVREELEGVEMARRAVGEGVGAEVEGLERGWREGVGRMLEALVAGERVRGEILERRRGGAV